MAMGQNPNRTPSEYPIQSNHVLPTKMGSLHYTPEHCLENGGFNLYFGVEKPMLQMVATWRSFGEPCFQSGIPKRNFDRHSSCDSLRSRLQGVQASLLQTEAPEAALVFAWPKDTAPKIGAFVAPQCWTADLLGSFLFFPQCYSRREERFVGCSFYFCLSAVPFATRSSIC